MRKLLFLSLLALTGPSPAQQMPGMSMPAPAPPPPAASAFPPLTPPTDLLKEAAAHPPLSLEDFLTRATRLSPTLDQYRAATARSEAEARQASLYPNPTLGYQGDQIRGGSFGGGERGAFLAQTIPLGGKLTARRKALEAASATTRLATDTESLRLRADVAQAFFAALAAQQTARVTRRLLLNAQDASQTAHQLANVGQADLPDVLQTELEQEQTQLADARAQRTFLALFHSLAALAGDPSLAPSPLAGDLAATPSFDPTTLDRLLAQSPAIQQAQAQVTAAEARLASARRDLAPDLQLKAGEQYNFEQLGSGPTNKPTGPQSFASAAITLPLWNRNQGNIQAAEADLARARAEVRRVQLTLRQQAAPLLETFRTATEEAAQYRTAILPRATRITELYERKYTEMAQAYPQVLVSRRTLLQLQLHYIDVLAILQRTAAALASGTLTGSLTPPAPASSAAAPPGLFPAD